jgi:hypothetical protein
MTLADTATETARICALAPVVPVLAIAAACLIVGPASRFSAGAIDPRRAQRQKD